MYHQSLVEKNNHLNLFSRKLDIDEIWVRHFLDSLSIFEIYQEMYGKNILDFGTGGGLPGVPIQIIVSNIFRTKVTLPFINECGQKLEVNCVDSKMVCLDSTKKKIEAVKNIVDYLKLKNVDFLDFRIEGKEMTEYHDKFDIIISRAVKTTFTIAQSMLKLLKKGGLIFLYKSNNYEDVKVFNEYNIHKIEFNFKDWKYSNLLGERNIIEIKK